MTTTTNRHPDLSTFPARLALVEHIHGWNHKEAATICGFSPTTWRHWLSGKHPQDYTAVCEQIAARADVDFVWLAMGPQYAAVTGQTHHRNRVRVAA